MADEKLEEKNELKLTDGTVLNYVPLDQNLAQQNVDRVVGIINLYYQHFGTDPIHAEVRFESLLETFDLEPVARKRIKPEAGTWKPLPFGDLAISDVGLMVFQNLAGKHQIVVPSEEEKKTISQQHIIIREAGSDVGIRLLVRSGRANLFEVLGLPNLEYTSSLGAFNGLIWLFPR